MNQQIVEEAAEWFVELNAGQPDRMTKQAFDAWLRKSPEHVRAYLEMLPTWEEAAAHPAASDAGVEELIALGRQPDHVIAWNESRRPNPSPAAEPRHRPLKRWRVSPLRMSLAVSLAAVFVAVALFGSQRLSGQEYTTAVGQQSTIQLADGSTVELNTDSSVRVRLGDHQRNVELIRGQALFRVAKDATRPFVVASSQTRIRAVGTEFDVYRRGSDTTVTVLEGKVAVQSDTALGTSLLNSMPLSAGEQVTINAPLIPARLPSPKRPNLAAATAWTQHRLIFDSTPLPQVVAEFNRYNTRHLIVDDGALNDFNVSGSFSSADPASLLRFLEAERGLTVHETAGDIYISKQ
jgi:transmembrane sensor